MVFLGRFCLFGIPAAGAANILHKQTDKIDATPIET
jgi:hypothetical protein